MMIKLRWIVLAFLIFAIAVVYLYPTPDKTFDELYAKVNVGTVSSLTTFRQSHPAHTLELRGIKWSYLALGEGPETILFLHGMTGAYDIWWQQMEALQDEYRVIAVTYPAVNTLEEMEQAVMAILEAEGVEQFYVVGSSLGGYFAQYLVTRHPNEILGMVFANTFPPNDIIAENNKTIGALLPYLPEWLVMKVLSGSMRESVYPASDYSELVLAFGLEQTYGRMSKAQVAGRFHCVVEPFEAPDMAVLGIPVMVIEADNDPLVEAALREQLRETYPTAEVVTLSNGHFPYLSMPAEYTAYLEAFFGGVQLR
jgi:pimeloyl-ACP methyl ester carboxylesterase